MIPTCTTDTLCRCCGLAFSDTRKKSGVAPGNCVFCASYIAPERPEKPLEYPGGRWSPISPAGDGGNSPKEGAINL